MDNRYNHFADEEMRNVERLTNEARNNAKQARSQWQGKMEQQLVIDILNILSDLGEEDIPDEILVWKSTMALKMLVHDFAAGLLYATEQLR